MICSMNLMVRDPYADTVKIHHSIIGGPYADLASNVSSPFDRYITGW